MKRRALLAAALGAGAGAFAGRLRGYAADSGGAELTQLPRSQRQTILPIIASDRAPAYIRVSAPAAYQGGALRVSAENSTAGSATVLGRTYPLSSGTNVAGFVGFGTEDPPGPATIAVTVTDLSGASVTQNFPITIERTQWTVDYITIPPPQPPDPNAPTPPPPPPDDNPLLPGIYAGRTARKWKEGWGVPLPLPLSVTGYFGEQRSFNGGPVQGHHGGTDLGANAGTPIYSTNYGVVVMSGLYLTRVNLVVVDHGDGVMSAYGHMQERIVTVGQTVAKGDTLGYVGTTGLSTGPHLHWEMRVRGIPVEPASTLRLMSQLCDQE